MNKFFILTSIFLSSIGFAEGPDLNAHKQEVLANLENRIAFLTEAKNCITAATDKESMKKCRTELKEDRGEMKDAMKDKKKERMENRMKKMEEKKAKLDKTEPKE